MKGVRSWPMAHNLYLPLYFSNKRNVSLVFVAPFISFHQTHSCSVNFLTVCYVCRWAFLSTARPSSLFSVSESGERGCVFTEFFAFSPEKGILGHITHCPIPSSVPKFTHF